LQKFFSTADVHSRDSFDYWHEVLCKKIIEHDCIPDSREGFRGELKGGAVGDISLVSFENSPAIYSRVTRRHVGHSNPDELLVVQQRAGTTLLGQAGREVLLETGDITLVDPRRPAWANHSKGARLVLKVPRHELEARVGKTHQTMAASIKPTAPEYALTSVFLEALATHSDALDPATADIVRNQALDLIAVSFAKAMDRDVPRVSSARALVLVNVRAAIEARLTDPMLDSDTVAAAAGVSVRYANAVLAEAGTSIMRLIRARRLERCRRALQDPTQAIRAISEIAYGWGFSDMTHFSRSFRAAFGLLPSEYRRLAKCDGTRLPRQSADAAAG
jgi:AraC family transcriptional regulator, positive regulator of tynA and feaB